MMTGQSTQHASTMKSTKANGLPSHRQMEGMLLQESLKMRRKSEMTGSCLKKRLEQDLEIEKMENNQFERTYISKEVEPLQVG